MKQKSQNLVCLSALTILAFGASSSWAGVTSVAVTDTKDISAPAPSEPLVYSQEFNLGYADTGRTTLKQGNSKIGSAEVQTGTGHYVFAPQINDNVILRFGFDGEMDSFGLFPKAPISNTLQAYNLDLGADFTLSDKIILRAELHPGLYGDNHLSFDDFNIPVQIGGTYLYSKDLQFILGFQLNLQSQIPFIGLPGIRWQIANHWILYAVPPKPQIQYEWSHGTFYFGAELAGNTFKMSDHFGDDRGHGIGVPGRTLNNSWMDYNEVRVGPGMTYKLTKDLTLDFSGGIVPYREFVYNRAKLTIHNDGMTPFVSLGISGSF